MPIITPVVYAKPSGVVVAEIPSTLQIVGAFVAPDEFEVSLMPATSYGDALDTQDAQKPGLVSVQNHDEAYGGRYFFMDAPLETRLDDDPDAQRVSYACEQDEYGCLEVSDEAESLVLSNAFLSIRAGTIPAYFITGITRDGVTTDPFPSVEVRVFRSSDNEFMGQTVSDGSGSYQFGVYDPITEYMLVAHVGNSPAGASRRDVKGL